MKLTELKKLSKTIGLSESLEDIGFSAAPSGFWFYRDRGEYLDVMSFNMYSSGNYFTVAVVCFKKELIDHCDMARFPAGFQKSMPVLSNLYISKTKGLYSATAWSAKSENSALESMEYIVDIVKSIVNPWFLKIVSDSAFYESVELSVRNSEFGKNLASKLNL